MGSSAWNTKAIARHQPDHQQTPEEPQGHRIVVPRDSSIQIAEHLLIDEVEPKEPVHLPLRWISDTGRDMPGRRDAQKNQEARKRVPSSQVADIPVEQ